MLTEECALQDYPMLLGNLVAILFSAFIVVVVSLCKPDNYDWKTTREIAMVDDSHSGKSCTQQSMFTAPNNGRGSVGEGCCSQATDA